VESKAEAQALKLEMLIHQYLEQYGLIFLLKEPPTGNYQARLQLKKLHQFRILLDQTKELQVFEYGASQYQVTTLNLLAMGFLELFLMDEAYLRFFYIDYRR
jgi:hypothetical protein